MLIIPILYFIHILLASFLLLLLFFFIDTKLIGTHIDTILVSLIYSLTIT